MDYLVKIRSVQTPLNGQFSIGANTTEQWYQAIGDNTLADAILDRLMHNVHRINLKGESMRKKMNSLTQVEHLE